MTPRQALARILEAGGRVIADPERPRLLVPPGLKPLVTEHREALRQLILEVTARPSCSPWPWPDVLPGLGPKRMLPFTPCGLCREGTWVAYGDWPRCLQCARDPGTAVIRRYHHALERWWGFAAEGPSADPAEIAETYQELLRLMDDVGEPTATRLRRRWAREWWWARESCPQCGEPGPYHEPGSPER